MEVIESGRKGSAANGSIDQSAWDFDLDRSEPRSWRQLYERIRQWIIDGRIPAGAPVPPMRALATRLGCSRTAIAEAVEQLRQEEYLIGSGGSTRVAKIVKNDWTEFASEDEREAGCKADLSRRGASLSPTIVPDAEPYRAFSPSLPDISLFPFAVWHRLARVWRKPNNFLLMQSDAGGYWPLRESICSYLRASRMIECKPEDVLITTGAQNGVDIVARLLLDVGDPVWVEDPGYPGLRGALFAAGAKIIPVPVDEDGMSVAAGVATGRMPRLIAVAPSYQYPLGTVMPLQRRLDLLALAEKSNCLIVEDDYDNEFRYAGRPLAALRSLSPSRVIYVGTFSKVLFPSLRLGYIVVPPELSARMAVARTGLDIQPSILPQPVVDAFMREGFFLGHVRKMRSVYRERQAALVQAVDRHLSDFLTVRPEPSGIHLLARFNRETDVRIGDLEVSRRAAADGVIAPPLSAYYHDRRSSGGLILGYAAVDEKSLFSAAVRLAVALHN
jgi:GntR family transcriptional regulator / MocR family aminotransferase